MYKLRKSLTPEKNTFELNKRDIDPDQNKVGSISERSCKYEDVHHLEELHVVKWYPPRYVGESVNPSKYFRLEDFLRTIPSQLRHDSVSRARSSQQFGTIKRPLSAQLIRKDTFLAPLLLERTIYQGKITKEHLWLADMVFSLLYFDTFRWKDQGGLDDIAASRKHVMQSGHDFVWDEKDQLSDDMLEGGCIAQNHILRWAITLLRAEIHGTLQTSLS
jgi:hypothetical protein